MDKNAPEKLTTPPVENADNILTKEGLEELKAELKRLIEVERPAVIAEIKDARSQGDLSENAEFDAAREKQGVIEDRIKDIESIIAHSVVLAKRNTTRVQIGSIVTIKDIDEKREQTFTIVGTLEADPLEHKISNVSPLASALIGKTVNDIVTVDALNKYNVQIIEIK